MALINFPRVFAPMTSPLMSYLDDNFTQINTVFGAATSASVSNVANGIPIGDASGFIRQWLDYPIGAPTGTVTFGAADMNKIQEFNSASAFTATLPAAASVANNWLWLKNVNTGVVTIGATVDGIVNPTLSIHDQAFIWSDGTSWVGFIMAPKSLAAHGMQVFTASGSFTAPVTGNYDVLLIGGGGGGGGGGGATNGGNGSGGGGGGAGSEARWIKTTQNVNDVVTITIGGAGALGAGGAAGGANNGVNGGTGGTTSYGSFSAVGGNGGSGGLGGGNGGTGGAGGTNALVAGGAGGGGGAAGTSTPGSNNNAGGAGGTGGSVGNSGGGGAGGASLAGRGGTGGVGANGGTGGAGGSPVDFGAGGGGGGGCTGTGAPNAGGNGAAGVAGLVIIWW